MKALTLRTFLLSAIAATCVLASTTIGLSTDATAATRRPHHQQRSQQLPVIRQDPYRSFNTFGAPGVSPYQGRRDVNPISGTPRWNAAGGAA